MPRTRSSRGSEIPPAPAFLDIDEAIRRATKKGPKPKPDPKILTKLGLDALVDVFGGVVLSRAVEDETLSGRRTNANDVAWLVVGGANAVDGDSGQISFLDTGFGSAILARLWLPVLKPNRKYLFQMRAVVRNRQPSSTGLAIIGKGKGTAGGPTSLSVLVPPADNVPFVATAFLTAEDTLPFVIFAGDKLSWIAYDIRIQHIP